MFEFANEINFDEKALSKESKRDKSLISLLKSSAIIAGSLKRKSFPKSKVQNPNNSKTRRLSTDLIDLCNREKALIQEREAEKIFNIINGEIVAMADKFLDYKNISTKEHLKVYKVSANWLFKLRKSMKLTEES